MSTFMDFAMNPNDLLLFVAAIEHGGFAAASRQLGVPKSTISKRVAELEVVLGARLIQRTSRSFTLTEAGRDFHQHALAARIEMEAAEEVVRRRVAEPSGTVRMTCSVPVAQAALSRLVPEMALVFPKLHVDLDVTDRFVDIVQEGYDMAIRSHFAPLPDSGLVQRQLQVEPVVLVASPAYLRERGDPSKPSDLLLHEGLLVGTHAREWTLFGTKGSKESVRPQPRLTANESAVLLACAMQGLGIACLAEGMCQEACASGKLRRILTGWHAGTVATTIVMPHRRGLLPSVRAVVDFLAARWGVCR